MDHKYNMKLISINDKMDKNKRDEYFFFFKWKSNETIQMEIDSFVWMFIIFLCIVRVCFFLSSFE